MGAVTYRANLSSVKIPLISEEFGRSIILKQQDQNFVPTTVSKADMDKDIGVPQAVYAHNVMPTDYGYKSVGYSTQITGLPVNTFFQAYYLESSTGQKVYVSTNSDGNIYYCSSSTNYSWVLSTNSPRSVSVSAGTGNTGTGNVTGLEAKAGATLKTYSISFTSATAFDITGEASGTVDTLWTSADGKVSFILLAGDTAFVSGDTFSITVSSSSFTGKDITKATVSGTSYLGVEGQGIYYYDFSTDSLTSVVATGISTADIKGVVNCGGYLLIYSSDTFAWSSLVSPTDFVPSLITGAGGGSVEGARGPIRKCVSVQGGILIFTAVNAVAATQSSNSRYPFNFREIANCGGLTDLSLCTDEAADASVYAFTTHGLQQITVQRALTLYPDVTDFLSGQYYESFDSDILEFNRIKLTSALKKRLEYVSGRYLVISYGDEDLQYALVFDTALQRYGKLKIQHKSAMQYGFLDADSADTPRRQLAFLADDGSVKTVDFTASNSATDSVILLGKYQFVRARTLQLQEVELETIDPDANCLVYDLPSMDGKTLNGKIAGYLSSNSGGSRKYNFHNTAMNHIIAVKGNFRLNSLLLTFNIHGNR